MYIVQTNITSSYFRKLLLYRYLKFLRDSLDPVFSRLPAPMIPNILELARTNLLLSEDLKERLLGNAPVFAAALDAGIQNGLSPAEKLAYQVASLYRNCEQHHIVLTFPKFLVGNV